MGGGGGQMSFSRDNSDNDDKTVSFWCAAVMLPTPWLSHYQPDIKVYKEGLHRLIGSEIWEKNILEF